MPNPSDLLIASDTNVLLDWADEVEDVLDALELIRTRTLPARLLVPPTVLAELGVLRDHAGTAEERQLAAKALRALRHSAFEPVPIVPVPDGVTEILADRLHAAGLLPLQEHNDALILAEAGFLGCAMLLTSDAHLRGLDFARTAVVMKSSDADMPVIATPREIVRKFFQR